MTFRLTLLALLASVLLVLEVQGDRPKDASEPDAKARESLQELQQLVGQWRGVGQLRRGSTKGAWREEGEWAWQFEQKVPALQFRTGDDARFVRQFRVTPLAKAQSYRLVAKSPEGEEAEYLAELDDQQRLVAVRQQDDSELPARITLRTVAGGDRLLVLFERQSTSSKRYLRLAEVGYTREGSGFGQGTNFVECIVTGGKGTIAVTYKDKTYYVCCTGCRDYFNDDPEAVLAEYQAAQEEKAKQAEQAKLEKSK